MGACSSSSKKQKSNTGIGNGTDTEKLPDNNNVEYAQTIFQPIDLKNTPNDQNNYFQENNNNNQQNAQYFNDNQNDQNNENNDNQQAGVQSEDLNNYIYDMQLLSTKNNRINKNKLPQGVQSDTTCQGYQIDTDQKLQNGTYDYMQQPVPQQNLKPGETYKKEVEVPTPLSKFTQSNTYQTNKIEDLVAVKQVQSLSIPQVTVNEKTPQPLSHLTQSNTYQNNKIQDQVAVQQLTHGTIDEKKDIYQRKPEIKIQTPLEPINEVNSPQNRAQINDSSMFNSTIGQNIDGKNGTTLDNYQNMNPRNIQKILRIYFIHKTNKQFIQGQTEFQAIIGEETPKFQIKRYSNQNEANTLYLNDGTVSSSHAYILYNTNTYFLIDTSSFGTFIQVEPQFKRPVNHQDTFLIGRSQFQFHFNTGYGNTTNLIIYKSRDIIDQNTSHTVTCGSVNFFKLATYNLKNDEVLSFGRDPSSNFVLDYEEDSRLHCILQYENNQLYIMDKMSLSGTWFRLQPNDKYPIINNMKVRFGETLIFLLNLVDE